MSRHDGVESQHFWLEHLLAAEGQELLRQRAARWPAFWIWSTASRMGSPTGIRCCRSFAVADDYAEEIVEIVRDAAGQPSDCVEFLRERELLFEELALGDIAIDDYQLFHVAGGFLTALAVDSSVSQRPSLWRMRYSMQRP